MKSINLEQLAVILVEPSSTQRHIISEYLSTSAITDLECVISGNDALRSMEKHKPHLVISAMYLPDMTGVELIEIMRTKSELHDVAFILISSETHISILEPIRQAGAIAIIPKPFAFEQLNHALLTTLDFIKPEQIKLDKFDDNRLKVLVVDDSRLSRQHLIRTLNKLGIQHITQAENGKAAIPLLEQQDFDLILTDYNMPEMDGKQLIAHIRSQEKFARTPVMMVTSETDMSRLAAVDQIGVSAIVDKPFETNIVRNLIQNIMNK